MIHHSSSRASAVLFSDQTKATTPKLSTKSMLETGLRQSPRVAGTLNLPKLVGLR